MKITLSDRERWLLFITMLLIGFYIFFQFLYIPRADEVAILKEKLSKQELQLNTIEQKVKLLEALELRPLEKLRAKKTKEEQTIEALRYISSTISKLDLDLLSIKPHMEEKSVGSAKVIFIDMTFLGKYNTVYRFMQAFEMLPILILVDSMTMTKSGSELLRVSMVVSVYY